MPFCTSFVPLLPSFYTPCPVRSRPTTYDPTQPRIARFIHYIRPKALPFDTIGNLLAFHTIPITISIPENDQSTFMENPGHD